MTATTVGLLGEAVWGGYILHAILIIFSVVCAIQALRSRNLLVSAIYLAGTSIFISIIFFLLGAHQVAVIELSVGAGLVTVILVFAINVAGENVRENLPVVPKPLAWGLVVCAVILLTIFVLPIENTHNTQSNVAGDSIPSLLWQQREVDVFIQVVLIFTGALGALGLLADEKAPLEYPAAEEVSAKRERELETILEESLPEEGI